jgi:hypothetical protein
VAKSLISSPILISQLALLRGQTDLSGKTKMRKTKEKKSSTEFAGKN